MKNKNVVIATIFFVMAMLMVFPLVSAANLTSVWNFGVANGSTTNYSNYTGSFDFNCTTSALGVWNVTVYANSSAGVMNPLQSFANSSPTQTAWIGTVSIQSADDGAAQNLSCHVRNATVHGIYSAEEGLGPVSIMLDSTSPLCNVSVQKPTIAYKGNQKITYYSSDNIERVSTSLTIDGPGQQTTITATGANGPIELGSNDTNYIGSWALDLAVTDRPGNTCTASTTFKSYLPFGDDELPPEEPTDKGTQLLGLIAVVAIIYFLFIKKK